MLAVSEVFGPAYAAAYDLFYAKKDYKAECDVIERAFAEFSAEPVHRVLDLGCGTGRHAIPLAGRGYDVVGVDRSPGMLAAARANAIASGVGGRVAFVHGDVTAVPDIAPCDAALMMFAVLGYQASQASVATALREVRRSLRTGGLFLFDVWHAPAVELEPPAQRWQIVERDGTRLIRLSSGRLDRAGEICTVTIRVLRLVGNRVTDDTVEHHPIRYFKRETLMELLDCSGLELICLGSFPAYWCQPDLHDWSVLCVARAIG
jgi:SAM-dependent methyltransferase